MEDTATTGQQNTDYLFSGRETKSCKIARSSQESAVSNEDQEKLEEDPLNLHYLGWYGWRRQPLQFLSPTTESQFHCICDWRISECSARLPYWQSQPPDPLAASVLQITQPWPLSQQGSGLGHSQSLMILVIPAWNASTQDAEAELLWFSGQPVLNSETLSQTQQQNILWILTFLSARLSTVSS